MIDASPTRQSQLSWRIAFAVCSVAAAVPLLVTYRLPMADLPQHAVQLTVWKFFDRNCYRFADLYEVNWLTPYLLGVMTMRVFASVTAVATALKAVVYLTILALPLALKRLTDYSGVDPWIALLGFPLSFGFSFYWGFINFNFVVPLVLLLLLVVLKATDAGGGRVAPTFILAAAVALCHALAYGFALLICGPVLLLRTFRDKRLWINIAALVAPVPVLAIWVLRSHSQQARARAPWEWLIHPGRVLEFFDFLLSAGADASAFWFTILLLVVCLLLGVGITAERWRIIPFIAAGTAFLLTPLAALGQTFLYPRLAIIVVATAIAGMRQRRPLIDARIGRTLVVVVIVSWMIVLTGRFTAFHRDADGFDRLVDALPSNQRVLLLNVVQSDVITGMPFLHFSGYYLERKGGVIGWSFSSNFPTVIRYRRGVSPGVPPIVTHDPRYFSWKEHSNFDYFIVRAPGDMTSLIFAKAGGNVQLLRRAGIWWLYENRTRANRDNCPPLERDGDHTPVLNLRW